MRRIVTFTLMIIAALNLQAQQIGGHVTDAETGEPIPLASVVYKGHDVSTLCDEQGRYLISRQNGWNLTFSAVGYKPRIIAVNERTKPLQDIKLKPDNQMLTEVKVKAKRRRYSRRDNPAVELMRRVIAAKKQTDLSRYDYYQYNKYEKLTLAMNDLQPEQLERKPFTKATWLLEQVERCEYNGKMILPISVDETVSQKVYRREPRAERTIIRGQQSSGVNDLFQTGDILNIAVKDVFTDVNLYDDQIRLLQYPFTSPIGKDAIAFYRFYIEDTVYVDKDRCIHLHFLPNNQQDFGFRGDLYVLDDSTLHVRRCELTIPKRSDVNFVENLQVRQEFTRLDNGEWVLTQDDMITEMKFTKLLQQALVVRTTRLSDYAFDPLPKSLFKGKRQEVREADAQMRGDDFWSQYRQVQLTKSESGMAAFVKHIEQIKGFKYVMLGLKALIENHVETGSPSKVDIGPVNTLLTHNYIDGWRIRASAQSTANLNKHLFLKGYLAHGFSSHKNYYDAEFIWSLNAKEYLPREFPRRTLTLQSTFDVCSPSDRFVPTDKDNFLVAFKWAEIDKMMTYNRQRLAFDYELDGGLRISTALKLEENEAMGNMRFQTLPLPLPVREGSGYTPGESAAKELSTPLPHREGLGGGSFRTTELHAELRYAAGEAYVNTKQRRLTINLDQPVFTIGHTLGLKNVFGGDYAYNYTEASIYRRFWMKSWGKIDCHLKGGIQWNQVPFPLLIHPAANQSYIIEDETFNLINNTEFLNDRYASLMVSWDMNGKLLNRVPLLHRLKWREYFGINVLWGGLSDKNNPLLSENANEQRLMYFPEGCYVMDGSKPYVEGVIGIHNIFKLLHVEYVRRFNYRDLPTCEKQGMRFTMRMTF